MMYFREKLVDSAGVTCSSDGSDNAGTACEAKVKIRKTTARLILPDVSIFHS